MQLRNAIVATFMLFFSGLSFALPAIQHWQTSNKANVYFVETNSVPMLDVDLMFNAGSIYAQKHPGLAALTNALIGEKTRQLNANQIASQFESVGAIFSQDTTKEASILSLRSLVKPAYLSSAIHLLARLLSQFDTDQAVFQRTKTQMLTAIQSEKESPEKILDDQFNHLLYGDDPYAQPVIGDAGSVKSMTQADVMQFYQRAYVASNLNIVLVGDISAEKARQIAEALTKNLSLGKKLTFSLKAKPLEQSQRQQIPYTGNQSYVLMGNLVQPMSIKERFAFMVGNQILGGSGLGAKLAQELREKRGLTYSISSGLSQSLGLRPFTLSFYVKHQQLKLALSVAHQTLTNYIQKGPAPAELHRAKRYLIDSFPMGLDSNAKIAFGVLHIITYHLPLDYFQTYTQNVRQVTAQQVRQVFQKSVNADKLLTVILGQGQV